MIIFNKYITKCNFDYFIKTQTCDFFSKFFFFAFFRAAPSAYGSSQARGQIVLQLLAYTTATAIPDRSYICDLYHSLWQRWILNPLSEARDRTRILMDTSQVFNPPSHSGNSSSHFFNPNILCEVLAKVQSTLYLQLPVCRK